MSTLLHISASPRGTDGDSTALAHAFLDSHRAVHPDVGIEHLDLFDGSVVYTSGVYSVGASPAFGRDLHSTLFTDWLQFIGIDQVTEIRSQPTVLAASRDQDRATALDHATAAGQGF